MTSESNIVGHVAILAIWNRGAEIIFLLYTYMFWLEQSHKNRSSDNILWKSISTHIYSVKKLDLLY